MAVFRDENNVKFRGIFKAIAKNKKTGEIKVLEEENLDVAQARTLMRDLVNGDNNAAIAKLQIGDMNKSLGDDISNLPAPQYSDTALVHKFFEKRYKTKEAITYDGRPAIKYTFVINEDEANDENNDDYNRKLWVEYGLAGNNGKIWNRKIKPIIKDNETEITIYWIFIF
jgi:hypothetical protein